MLTLHGTLKMKENLMSNLQAYNPLVQPTYLQQPICAGGSANVDYIIPPFSSANPSIITQQLGVPPAMQQPLSTGGTPVDRAGTNGLNYLMSQFLVFLNAGGVFTFDTNNTAGYSQGAMLWCASASRFVISLVNNNTKNFITTPAFIDNVNWAYASFPDITDTNGVVTIPKLNTPTLMTRPNVTTSTNPTVTSPAVVQSDLAVGGALSFGFFIQFSNFNHCTLSNLDALYIFPDFQDNIYRIVVTINLGDLNTGTLPANFNMNFGRNVTLVSLVSSTYNIVQNANPSAGLITNIYDPANPNNPVRAMQSVFYSLTIVVAETSSQTQNANISFEILVRIANKEE